MPKDDTKQLSKDVDAVEKDMDEAEKDIDTLEKRVAGILKSLKEIRAEKSNYTSFESRICENETKITKLNNNMTAFKKVFNDMTDNFKNIVPTVELMREQIDKLWSKLDESR